MDTFALRALDGAVVLTYFVVVAAVGLWHARGARNTRDYFTANRQIPTWAVGFTLMATLISSNTLVAHSAVVYQKGMILAPGFLALPIVLWAVARYLVPFYRRVVGMSAYEYIGKRFGLGGRLYTAGGFLLDRTFDVGVTLVTTAIVLNVMTGWSITLIVLGLALFTVAYTSIGGIQAVVWTDVVQGIILMGGGLFILGRLLWAPELEGFGAAVGAAWNAGKFSPGDTQFTLESWFASDTTTMWIFMFGMSLVWARRYVCDQNMVQRYLIAKTDAGASRGALLGAALSLPVLLMFNLIGAALFGFYSAAGLSGPEIGDHVLPHFIMNFLPSGLVGLLLAAILAASMSSISSDLNSVGTVISTDFLPRIWSDLPASLALRLGRLAVLGGGLASAWVALQLVPDEASRPIAEKALTVVVIVSAGTLGLFCLGFFTRTATRRGCYAGLGACVLFTIWGVLTEPRGRLVDLGALSFPLNPMMIGVLGHAVVFAVGLGVSRIWGGYRPADLDDLIFDPRRVRPNSEQKTMEPPGRSGR